jgi:glycosyltransferase involved in cell wall biosynthesis
MSETTPPSAEPIAVVIPVHNAAERVATLVTEWNDALCSLGREYALIVVNDGSTDGTAAALAQLATRLPLLRLVSHEKRLGFGACLRTALAEVTLPLVAYVLPDYPYRPADLPKLLDRLAQPAEVPVYEQPVVPDAASGCRTGRRVPAFWRGVGWCYRTFCRVILGATIEPLHGWLGWRNHVRSWFIWLTMGVPLTDVNSGFKVFRRSVFDRFPLQSDGDFVHAEIFAKLTFLSCLVAEEPLTPAVEAVPPSQWSDFWRVFKYPAFHHPLPDLSQAMAPPPPAPLADGVVTE